MRTIWLAAMLVAVVIRAVPVIAEENYAFDDLVYLTCEEAWQKSGESTEETVAMIRVLAEFSLEKRQLVVPEDRGDLSEEFGGLIKAFCTAQPDDLLFNAVDQAIRRLL